MKNRMPAFILMLCIIWGSCCGLTIPTTPVTTNNYHVGDIVTFGSYEQDNKLNNGSEEIKWIVLDVKDQSILLLSKDVLDAYRFNNSWAEITWDDSGIREWLNDTFYYNAFSLSEQLKIQSAFASADRNPYFSHLDPGSSTLDKVFLLSVDEVESYIPNTAKRGASATDYARSHGAFISKSYTVNGRGTAWWWLRSPGGYQGVGYKSYAAIIDGSGAVSGHEVYNSGYDGSVGGVRPAIWIRVS